MVELFEINDKNFEKEVTEADTPVLVDFWAPWCGPCRMVGPIMQELANQYDGKLKVAKLNVQDNSEVPALLGIRSIPTVVLMDGRAVIDMIIGARPKAAFEKMVSGYLKKADRRKKKEDENKSISKEVGIGTTVS